MLQSKLFDEADLDIRSIPLDGIGYQGRLVKGVKIVMDIETQEIKIYNTSLGGDFYQEINKKQYKIFEVECWKSGVRSVQIANLKRTIRDKIRLMNQEPTNGRRIRLFQNKIKKLKEELSKLKN